MNSKRYELNKVEIWDGNTANAHALRQASVDVISAYPITPSTATVENYASFKANGYIDGEVMIVESEHAAMSGCVGAAAAGARAATATASQGLALMSEVLYQASGMRLPIVLCLVNRALASPLNVNGDHSDMYMVRDSGWIQLDSCNPQEAYDLTLCAFRIGEDERVRLPVISNQDGFMTSHTAQNMYPLSDEEAYKFVGDYKAINSLLDFKRPVTHGMQTEEDWHFEHKAKQHNALMNSPSVIEEIFQEFEQLTGRKYNRVETYQCDDADVVIVCLGTTYESAKVAVDDLRKEGLKVGVLMPRVIRPFPVDLIAKNLQNVKLAVCMDRSSPAGAMGMLYNEVAGALINSENKPMIKNIIYGLGGRDMTINTLKEIYIKANNEAQNNQVEALQEFVGVRGPELKYFKNFKG